MSAILLLMYFVYKYKSWKGTDPISDMKYCINSSLTFVAVVAGLRGIDRSGIKPVSPEVISLYDPEIISPVHES